MVVSARRIGPRFLTRAIAALKAGLELNPEQEKNWGPLWNGRYAISPNSGRPASPRGRIGARRGTIRTRTSRSIRSTVSPARPSVWPPAPADMQKLAAAAKPLYDSLDDSQKRRFAVLFHGSMGHGQWRHWRRDG